MRFFIFKTKLACAVFAAALALALPGPTRADYDAGLKAYQLGNFAAALNEFKRLADRGLPAAYTSLGYMYAAGEGVEADMRTAAAWFVAAAKSGSAAAQMTVGILHFHGEGVKRDLVRAYGWLNAAGAAGRADAFDYALLVGEQMDSQQIARGRGLARKLIAAYGDPDSTRLMDAD